MIIETPRLLEDCSGEKSFEITKICSKDIVINWDINISLFITYNSPFMNSIESLVHWQKRAMTLFRWVCVFKLGTGPTDIEFEKGGSVFECVYFYLFVFCYYVLLYVFICPDKYVCVCIYACIYRRVRDYLCCWHLCVYKAVCVWHCYERVFCQLVYEVCLKRSIFLNSHHLIDNVLSIVFPILEAILELSLLDYL